MHVIKFLKANRGNFSKLAPAFGIKVKEYQQQGRPSLFVLNYDQIESPKLEPVVQECRGLILDDKLNIICRPFDRFFNYGEAGTDTYDFTGYTFHPKLDGSLIKVYHWYGMWRIATRGTAFAESPVGDHGITFEHLALKAFGCASLAEFDGKLMNTLQFNVSMTYLFELTAPENRVVTPYPEASATLLAVRDNNTGKYFPTKYVASFGMFKQNKAEEGYTIQEIVKKADSLKNLEEGFVGYDKHGVPQVKVKSAAYVAVHHIRGEGLSVKRCCELVLTGEEEEYLAYFPEDRSIITPYSEALATLLSQMESVYDTYKGIEDQKEFALAVKDYSFKSVLFTARKCNISTTEAFHKGTIQGKVELLKTLLKEN